MIEGEREAAVRTKAISGIIRSQKGLKKHFQSQGERTAVVRRRTGSGIVRSDIGRRALTAARDPIRALFSFD